MYGITKEMTFEAAHRLLDYDGLCKYLHGHSYKVQISVCSEALDRNGFVIDFGELKMVANELLSNWDHATILQKGDPLIPVLQSLGQRVVVLNGPASAEFMAATISSYLTSKGINVSQVVVYETANNCASVC